MVVIIGSAKKMSVKNILNQLNLPIITGVKFKEYLCKPGMGGHWQVLGTDRHQLAPGAVVGTSTRHHWTTVGSGHHWAAVITGQRSPLASMHCAPAGIILGTSRNPTGHQSPADSCHHWVVGTNVQQAPLGTVEQQASLLGTGHQLGIKHHWAAGTSY